MTKYVAQRLIERDRALADGSLPAIRDLEQEARLEHRRRRGDRQGVPARLVAGFAILIVAALAVRPEGMTAISCPL